MEYSPIELMICTAASLLEDGATVGVGTGAPCAAAVLAKLTHASNMICIFEAGGFDPILASMPISVGDSRTCQQATQFPTMAGVFEMCQQGWVDYAFLGGAQIDMYGNLNSTIIGDYDSPAIRLPGSGGANDFASFCWKTVVMTHLDPRRFVEKVDFITTPGFLDGGNARDKAGLTPGTGPYAVITDLACFDYEPESKRMRIRHLSPGATVEQVQSNVGFELLIHPELSTLEPPSEQALDLLRNTIDPDGMVIGR